MTRWWAVSQLIAQGGILFMQDFIHFNVHMTSIICKRLPTVVCRLQLQTRSFSVIKHVNYCHNYTLSE